MLFEKLLLKHDLKTLFGVGNDNDLCRNDNDLCRYVKQKLTTHCDGNLCIKHQDCGALHCSVLQRKHVT